MQYYKCNKIRENNHSVMSLNKKSPIVSQAGVFFTKVTMYSKTIENRKQQLQSYASRVISTGMRVSVCGWVGGCVLSFLNLL